MNKIFALLLIASLTFSCTPKDEVIEPASTDIELNGEWNLKRITGFVAQVYLEDGEHVWTIDTDFNSVLIEEDLLLPENIVVQPGLYDLELTGSTVTLENDSNDYSFSNYTIEADTLVVEDNPELDGPIYIFHRN